MILALWTAIAVFAPAPAPPVPPGAVVTWHNDEARTGQNPSETSLNPATVTRATFGLVEKHPVDGMIYAQPLVVPGLRVAGGVHDVVFVATEHDSVYAFDARARNAPPLWRVSFIDPAHGITTVPCTNKNQPECDPTILVPEFGITATPVIDLASRTMYVVAKTLERGAYHQRLHALELTSGAEKFGGPADMTGTASGFPGVRFAAKSALSRAGLALHGGAIYTAFASNDDAPGWILRYDARTLASAGAFCVAPTGQLGGIWQGGAAPAADANGYLYALTGNGTFDANTGGSNYGMSMLKLSTAAAPSVADFFSEFNESKLSQRDLDFASGGVVVLPNQPGPHPHEILGAGKDGKIFLVDRDDMGEFSPHQNHVLETVDGNPNGYYSTAAYFGGAVYYAGVGDRLKRFPLSNGLLDPKPASMSPMAFNYPGATPSISSDGTRDAIVWTLEAGGNPSGGPPARLIAFDAADVSRVLYDSARTNGRDRAGAGVKYTPPTVAGGAVYVATQTELDVFGLLRR